jgi:hypothetical protein
MPEAYRRRWDRPYPANKDGWLPGCAGDHFSRGLKKDEAAFIE